MTVGRLARSDHSETILGYLFFSFFFFDSLLSDTAAVLGSIYHRQCGAVRIRGAWCYVSVLLCPTYTTTGRVVQSNECIITIEAKSFLQLGDFKKRVLEVIYHFDSLNILMCQSKTQTTSQPGIDLKLFFLKLCIHQRLL